RIRQLVDSTTDPVEFAKATLADDRSATGPWDSPDRRQSLPQRSTPQTSPFFREAKITVLGTEPLKQGETKAAADEPVP
ncbi:MAG TPA: hypothetical protein VKH44_08340, partial [Pirellulaceae bacterium]|nr:hypothetical protein [Pirellulaceae bacterium]